MKSKIIITILFFSALIGLWEIIFYLKWKSPAVLPSPIEVFLSFQSFFSDKYTDIFSTIKKSTEAFILSVPIGIIAGYLIFYAKKLRYSNELFLDFLRSIPATALIPIFMMVFGANDTTKIAIGTFSSSLIICLSTIQGLKNRNITRLQISNIIGLSNFKRFLYIDIPESLSQIFIGLRAGVSLALILVVVSEMFIGSEKGLGKVINDTQYSDAIPKVYCALIVTGIIGYLYNYLIILLEKKIIHWQGH
jgi:NitT/TauT family transport system permease protein